jgi:DNA repair protein RecN (Recombination protein N)
MKIGGAQLVLIKYAFEARTNKGQAIGAIDKIASGGELARFLLALKVVLSEGEPDKCLIFDEVDSGVGGAVADAVGSRLSALGKTTQTLGDYSFTAGSCQGTKSLKNK